MAMPRFSFADIIKLGGLLVLGGIWWATTTIGISDINRRLEKIEANQSNYLRSDLAEERQHSMDSKLDSMKAQLERIEMKMMENYK